MWRCLAAAGLLLCGACANGGEAGPTPTGPTSPAESAPLTASAVVGGDRLWTRAGGGRCRPLDPNHWIDQLPGVDEPEAETPDAELFLESKGLTTLTVDVERLPHRDVEAPHLVIGDEVFAVDLRGANVNVAGRRIAQPHTLVVAEDVAAALDQMTGDQVMLVSYIAPVGQIEDWDPRIARAGAGIVLDPDDSVVAIADEELPCLQLSYTESCRIERHTDMADLGQLLRAAVDDEVVAARVLNDDWPCVNRG